MAEYYSWTETVTRRYFAVPSPTNGTELSKAITAAMQGLAMADIKYFDDTLLVEAHDDAIHISFEISKEKT